MTIPQAFAFAVQHHRAGRLKEAEALYRQILAVQPNHAEAMHHLGIIAHQVGRHDLAVEWIGQAVVLDPKNHAAHCNLGEAHRALGHFDEAAAAYRCALQLNPAFPAAHNNLGIVLRERSQYDEAVAAFRRALEFKPDYVEAYNNLGTALRDGGYLDEATAAYRRALELQPDYAEAHINLGAALRDRNQLDGAVTAFRRALELKPDSADAYNNLGTALKDQGLFGEAMAAYRQALQLRPGFGLAKFNHSLLSLLHGDFEQGWPLFEARWDALHFAERCFSQPRWDGNPLRGKCVLLYAEQGFGDSIQFIRYAPLIVQRGGRVVVECQPELKSLLATVAGISQVLDLSEPLPDFDLYCPMLSLPLVFGTRVETIPAGIPYLRADPIQTARWRERLDQHTGRADAGNPSPRPLMKIGLLWAGGARPHQPDANATDRRRSMRLSQFGPLAAVPGVVFVSLQKGPPASQAQTPPEGMTLLDWTDDLHDFADTAALVEALDLVITVDTAVAHLAGALGKPVWVLSRFDGCWRWLLDRTDSPWYPTMRLFRQTVLGDWDAVVQNVVRELSRPKALLST